jgi:hypothetical protein
VAQLGARFHGMEEVVGSIPTRSTILSITYGFRLFLFWAVFEQFTTLDFPIPAFFLKLPSDSVYKRAKELRKRIANNESEIAA